MDENILTKAKLDHKFGSFIYDRTNQYSAWKEISLDFEIILFFPLSFWRSKK